MRNMYIPVLKLRISKERAHEREIITFLLSCVPCKLVCAKTRGRENGRCPISLDLRDMLKKVQTMAQQFLHICL